MSQTPCLTTQFFRVLPLLFALFLMILFPPWRRVGDWHGPDSACPAAPEVAAKFDRWNFGYEPTYRWAGSESPWIQDGGVEIDGYKCSNYRFELEMLWVGFEVVFAGIPLAIIAVMQWRRSNTNPRVRLITVSALLGFCLFSLGAVSLRDTGIGGIFLLLFLVLPGAFLLSFSGLAAVTSFCGWNG